VTNRINRLDSHFAAKLNDVLTELEKLHIEMRVYCSDRNLLDQAKLWRQSRTRKTIDGACEQLRAAGAPYIAHIIEIAGPQFGPRVTNAVPGNSWHQWGEAIDAVWIVDGKAEWSPIKLEACGSGPMVNGYREMAKLAKDIGLTSGGNWNSPDWPHLQFRQAGAPDDAYSWDAIEERMKARYGHE
jgi:peptidoglycan L-alanyl-D-glutamate endopeptidase CwlK